MRMASWKNAWVELENSVKGSAEKLTEKKGMVKEKQIVNEMLNLMKYIAERNNIPMSDIVVPNEKKETVTANKAVIKKNTSSTRKKKRTYRNKRKSIIDKALDFLGLD